MAQAPVRAALTACRELHNLSLRDPLQQQQRRPDSGCHGNRYRVLAVELCRMLER